MIQAADLGMAVGYALRAPSVHNTQPWRWRILAEVVELHADWTRHLPVTDPERRDLIVSCGAALHHLRVACAARGLAVGVDRLPDSEDLGHLATVVIRSGPGDPVDAALFPAIHRRRTERRRMSHRPVSSGHLRSLAEQAHRVGALLILVSGVAMRQRFAAALIEAAQRQEFTPGYPAELRLWTRRYAAARDGVSAASVAPPLVGLPGVSALRRFPRAQLGQPWQLAGHGAVDDAAELLVIATVGDDPCDWLRAGEATSAVLLAATGMELATTPLSQALEVARSRRELQREVLHAPEYPHLIIRVGWPASGAGELPVTPRRELGSVPLPAWRGDCGHCGGGGLCARGLCARLAVTRIVGAVRPLSTCPTLVVRSVSISRENACAQ